MNWDNALKIVGSIGGAGGLVLAISVSPLDEAEKLFGITIFFLIVFMVYSDMTYLKRKHRIEVGKSKSE